MAVQHPRTVKRLPSTSMVWGSTMVPRPSWYSTPAPSRIFLYTPFRRSSSLFLLSISRFQATGGCCASHLPPQARSGPCAGPGKSPAWLGLRIRGCGRFKSALCGCPSAEVGSWTGHGSACEVRARAAVLTWNHAQAEGLGRKACCVQVQGCRSYSEAMPGGFWTNKEGRRPYA